MTRILSAADESRLADLLERIVPGSVSIGAVDYVDRVACAMPEAAITGLRAAIGVLAEAAADDRAFAAAASTPAFGYLRAFAIAAYYGDYAAPGHVGPTGWDVIGFDPPQARRLHKDWSFLDGQAEP